MRRGPLSWAPLGHVHRSLRPWLSPPPIALAPPTVVNVPKPHPEPPGLRPQLPTHPHLFSALAFLPLGCSYYTGAQGLWEPRTGPQEAGTASQSRAI